MVSASIVDKVGETVILLTFVVFNCIFGLREDEAYSLEWTLIVKEPALGVAIITHWLSLSISIPSTPTSNQNHPVAVEGSVIVVMAVASYSTPA